MLERVVRGARALFRREPWWAEFWSGVTALSWSALSYGGAGAHDPWPSMRVLTEVLDGRFWPLSGGGLGVAQLVFLLFDQRWLRWGAAVALCWFWGVMTLGVWAALPWAPGVAIYAGWCGVNMFSIARLLREYG